MVFAVIVQARMGSSRFPGKVLEPLGDRSALAVCLDRCARIKGVDVVVCTTPYGAENDPIAEEAARFEYTVIRGPEDDVLGRYALAAAAVEADLVMRVTSDCPLIDPGVCGEVVELFQRTRSDYACNNMPPKFPHGMDCEVFAAERLYEADWLARTAYDREHVTPYLRREAGYRRAALTGPGRGLERLRWTLDFPEDLTFLQGVAEALDHRIYDATWLDIVELCLRRPDLVVLNENRIDDDRLSASTSRADIVTPPAPVERVA